MIKIFPSKEYTFKLISNQAETLNRLNRRTEKSEYLTSRYTDKSFRGKITGNQFKIISSVIGKGAFCVISGEINTSNGHVKVEIHKAFKILLSIILCFPIIGFFIQIFTDSGELWPIMILVAILQILMMRFLFIGLTFKWISRTSMNRLRDVLDFVWIKN